MESRILLFPLLVPLLVLVMLLAVLFVAVIVSDRGGARQSSPLPPHAPPAPPPFVRREGRLSILQRLADRRITIEDAERELLALGDPVPAAFPSPPPALVPPRGRGCLLTLLVCFLTLCVLLPFLLFMCHVSVVRVHPPPFPGAMSVHMEAGPTFATTMQTPVHRREPQAEITGEDMLDWQVIQNSPNQEQP